MRHENFRHSNSFRGSKCTSRITINPGAERAECAGEETLAFKKPGSGWQMPPSDETVAGRTVASTKTVAGQREGRGGTRRRAQGARGRRARAKARQDQRRQRKARVASAVLLMRWREREQEWRGEEKKRERERERIWRFLQDEASTKALILICSGMNHR